MKPLLLFAASLCLSFVISKSPSIAHFRSLFPEAVLSADDTLHFGPDEFKPGSQDSAGTSFIEIVLGGGTSATPVYEYHKGNFFLPVVRGNMNGREFYVVEYGDTNDIASNSGKEVRLYLPGKKGFVNARELASLHAGKGFWYETDSWFVDLNQDGKIDILSRRTGQYILLKDNGTHEGHGEIISVDKISACTLNDTGFVVLPVINPDSLKEIYRNSYKRYD